MLSRKYRCYRTVVYVVIGLIVLRFTKQFSYIVDVVFSTMDQKKVLIICDIMIHSLVMRKMGMKIQSVHKKLRSTRLSLMMCRWALRTKWKSRQRMGWRSIQLLSTS